MNQAGILKNGRLSRENPGHILENGPGKHNDGVGILQFGRGTLKDDAQRGPVNT